MSTVYQVTISMDAHTVEALYNSRYGLYAFAAVQCSDQAGAPLVWMKLPYLENTVVKWPAKYAVYTALPGAGGPVVPGFSVPVALGQTLTVQPSGIGVVTEEGTAGAVTILNGTPSPFRCGISQPASGEGMAPVCVMPLYGNFSQIIKPLPQILLLFAAQSPAVGEAASIATGPGVLVDLDGASHRAVRFDVNEGWDWGKATWGTPVPAGTALAPLLVEPSPGLAAHALRLASDRATGVAAPPTASRPAPGPAGRLSTNIHRKGEAAIKTVIGGAVHRQDQDPNLSAGVDHIDFPDVDAGAPVVPAGAQGTMWLTAPPPAIGRYDVNDVLDYRDGNHNNDTLLDVLQVVGPSKYTVRTH